MPARAPSWFELVVAGAVVAVAVAACSVTKFLPVGGFNDDAIYVALGRALATGQGYHSMYLAGAPLHSKYPPLFPALLALYWRAGGTLEMVRSLALWTNLAACGVAAAMLWWVARARLGISTALIAAATIVGFLLDPSVQYFTLVLSEPLFIFGWAAVLVLYEQWRSAAGDKRAPKAVVIGLALAACALTRGEGIVLVPAVLLALALDGATRREWSLAAVSAAIPLALWHGGLALALRHHAAPVQPNESGYLQLLLSGSPATVFAGELGTIGLDVRGYGGILSTFLSGSSVVGTTATAAILLAFLCGAYLLRRTGRALVLSTVATLAVILAWPAQQDRLIVPLLPFVAVIAVYGIHVAIQSLLSAVTARRVAQGVVALAGVLVFARQASIRTDGRRARAEHRPPQVMTPSAWMPGNVGFMLSLARWAVANTRPDDRIAVASAPGVWLYSGRTTVPTEFAEPEGMPSVFAVPGRYLTNLLAARLISVVVVEASGAPIARDVMVVRRQCPQSLAPMPGFPRQAMPAVFRVMPDSTCIAALRDSLQPTSPPAHQSTNPPIHQSTNPLIH